MTRSELEQLTECGHDLAAKVALAIIAAANVGPCNMEVQADMETIASVSKITGIESFKRILYGFPANVPIVELRLSFMEVDAVIYARVNR
jgi:hypothetical protein